MDISASSITHAHVMWSIVIIVASIVKDRHDRLSRTRKPPSRQSGHPDPIIKIQSRRTKLSPRDPVRAYVRLCVHMHGAFAIPRHWRTANERGRIFDSVDSHLAGGRGWRRILSAWICMTSVAQTLAANMGSRRVFPRAFFSDSPEEFPRIPSPPAVKHAERGLVLPLIATTDSPESNVRGNATSRFCAVGDQ